ncbi:hypothetical protein [Haloglomus irregulare]|uniref:hypothetical protein n=1 Tax=Haloglomus irregulare TaxID=2234134 RepID=UPI00163DBC55|nr:hypothetical protein [Haloglomus irregulare]
MRVGDHSRHPRCRLRYVLTDGDRTAVLHGAERSTWWLSDGQMTAMADGYRNS